MPASTHRHSHPWIKSGGAAVARPDIDAAMAIDAAGGQRQLSWVISRLREKLSAMVDRAGYWKVAESLDQSAVMAGLA